MITNEVEQFTAQTAIKAELYDAIKRGETKFAGYYELSKNGDFSFKQQNFIFTDVNGNLRVGRFETADEVLNFMSYIKEREDKENA